MMSNAEVGRDSASKLEGSRWQDSLKAHSDNSETWR